MAGDVIDHAVPLLVPRMLHTAKVRRYRARWPERYAERRRRDVERRRLRRQAAGG